MRPRMTDEITLDTPESFFSGPTLELWNTIVPAELTAAEVAFLTDRFRGISGRQTPRLLDLACGSGRHALALAKARFEVTALDLAESELATLSSRARAMNLPIETVALDMREVGVMANNVGFKAFDGAYIFGNAVGYVDQEQLDEFFDEVAAVVRIGGRLVFETSMVAEALLHRFQDAVAIDAGDIKVHIENDYDVVGSRVIGTYTYEVRGEKVVKRFAHHVVTTRELFAALESAGFEVEQALGDLEGSDFELHDPRLIVVARRVEV